MPVAPNKESQSGTISIFSYSGFIIVADGIEFDPLEFYDAGFLFHFIGPVRIASPTWRPIPQFTPESFKHLFPNAPDNLAGFSMVSLPFIGEDGNPCLKSIWSDQEAKAVRNYRDTFVVVIFGKNSDDLGTRLAQSHLHRVIDWLRILTGQWWLGKSSENVTGHLHLQLELGADEKIHGHPVMRCNVASSHERMRLLDREMWEEAVSKARDKIEAPLEALMLMDGAHALHSGDQRQGIVLLVNAIEIARNKTLGPCRGTNLLSHLRFEFERKFGRRLDEDSPASYSFLKSLWVCRGHIAHGKEAVWITGTGKTSLESISTKYLLDNTEAIVEWIIESASEPISSA